MRSRGFYLTSFVALLGLAGLAVAVFLPDAFDDRTVVPGSRLVLLIAGLAVGWMLAAPLALAFPAKPERLARQTTDDRVGSIGVFLGTAGVLTVLTLDSCLVTPGSEGHPAGAFVGGLAIGLNLALALVSVVVWASSPTDAPDAIPAGASLAALTDK